MARLSLLNMCGEVDNEHTLRRDSRGSRFSKTGKAGWLLVRLVDSCQGHLEPRVGLLVVVTCTAAIAENRPQTWSSIV